MWFRLNKLVVNTSKTKYIIIHTKGKTINTSGTRKIVYAANEPNTAFTLSLVKYILWTKSTQKIQAKTLEAVKSWELIWIKTWIFNTSIIILQAKLSRSPFFNKCVKNLLPLSALKNLSLPVIASPHNLLWIKSFSCKRKPLGQSQIEHIGNELINCLFNYILP